MIKLKSLLREDPASDVESLITKVKNYDEFVKKLGDLAKDPKVQAFIKSGKADGDSDDDKMNAVPKSIAVKDLRPTQNEIDMGKSLKFPLTNAKSLINCLQHNTVTIVAPIVTYNGEYIIDGHHRWSQLYAVNATATISAIDLQGPKMNPVDVLKIVQLAIAGELGKVPTAKVEGINLLTVDMQTIKKYVIETVTPECIAVFKKFRSKVTNVGTAVGIADGIILPNVKQMRQTSQPVPGAPKRDVMPQTDDATDAMSNIAKGVINFNKPYQYESKTIKLTDLIREEEAPKCPIATQNIDVNLKHRQIAIERYGYGPLNPNNPNIKFWREKVQMWKLDSLEEAKAARCNNCAAFNITTRILNCIEKGLAAGEKEVEPATQPESKPEMPTESLNEISTLGVSGLKRFAAKHGYSVTSKFSGGRVPYMKLTKNGKTFGPFDPTTTTLAYLSKTLGIVTEDEENTQPAEPELDDTKDVASQDAWDTIEAGKLGYCTMHKFKCAGSRTCNAWIEGGPVKDK